MKKIKTIVCILFAAIMISATVVPAFADITARVQYYDRWQDEKGSPVGINSTAVELPETGGPGTAIFYAFSGVLVLGAGVLLVTGRRRAGRR